MQPARNKFSEISAYWRGLCRFSHALLMGAAIPSNYGWIFLLTSSWVQPSEMDLLMFEITLTSLGVSLSLRNLRNRQPPLLTAVYAIESSVSRCAAKFSMGVFHSGSQNSSAIEFAVGGSSEEPVSMALSIWRVMLPFKIKIK